ncbi:MAG: molybdopterin-dependent oxidoreductase [Polyangiaceae bacterium]
MTIPTKHFRTCPLCEAICGLELETDGERVTAVRGDPDDPFSRGFLCPKGAALGALHEDPDRLRRPLLRDGATFREVGWEEALDAAARGLHSVQEKYGRDALASYLGNPTVHNTGALVFGPTFSRALRTKNRFSATSVDQLPHQLAAFWMFGHQFLLPIPDVDRTDFMLILGANPVASNGSLMTAPDMRGRLERILARGGKVVVVDPRRNETARVASEHHFIRPGTDVWLLAAIVAIALDEAARGRSRGLGRAAAFSENLDTLREVVQPFTPAVAAERTGLAPEIIERLALELARAPSAIVYGRFGLSTQRHGGLCQWLVNAANLVTGNFDRPGGVLFTRPAIDAVDAPSGMGISRGGFGRFHTRVRKLPEFGGELPVAALAEDIATPGEGQIRGLITIAGNPVLSTPTGSALDAALAGLEFMVSVDFYLNETTRHAHVILPPPSPLERPHYDVAFHHLAVRNTAKFAPALFAPGPDQRPDHVILLELTRRLLALRKELTLANKLQFAALERLGVEGMLDLGLRGGPYGLRALPGRKPLSLRALERAPHGIDLGALEPSMPGRMKRWKRAIDLAPAPAAEALRALASSEIGARAELVLVGRRHLRSNNSWLHNLPKLVAGKPICTLEMHPDDARARGIESGATVTLSSRVGDVEALVELTDAVMPGVVSLPHGFGHGRPRTQLTVASATPGPSVNDVTDASVVDELTGNAVLSGVPVTVRAGA